MRQFQTESNYVEGKGRRGEDKEDEQSSTLCSIAVQVVPWALNAYDRVGPIVRMGDGRGNERDIEFDIVHCQTAGDHRPILVFPGCAGLFECVGWGWLSRKRRELNIPAPEILQPPYKMEVAYYLLGDQAFAMKEYCLRPYGGMHAADSIERYFKHRHSRARRVVENAFSIAVKLWRVLSKPIELEPHVAEKVVMATIHLHNFRRRHLLYNYTSAIHLPPTRSTESSSAAHNENSGEELPSSMLSLPAPLRPTRTLQNMRSHLAQHFKANDPLPFSLPHPHRQ
ncbi:uncharacterized protein LOC131264591 [Anopheles coustani]|uniref:uncharacterized protein LOC131264591 n=1 Tax=Anopheles coustani TaxID=139045 RepID=UPI002658D3F3|nr:uncharacterized protein LOC131264591 [Anopheles coustani]